MTADMSATSVAATSLSESWASLSNSDYSPEEDLQSEHTDAGSLMDITSSIDGQSVQDQEPQSSQDPYALNDAGPASQHTIRPDPVAGDGQLPTHAGVINTQLQSFESIEFDEPDEWPEEGHVDLRHTLTIFNEAEHRDILTSFPQSSPDVQLTGSIRMTMSKTGLHLDQPFRMLYNGSPFAVEARADILRKVGDALVAGSDMTSIFRSVEASRYHVIPSEFGPGSSPNFADLVPIQTQLIVEECVDASHGERGFGEDWIALTLKSKHVVRSEANALWMDKRGRIWNPPTIAILLVCKNDSPQRQQTTRLIHKCMARHHIPTLVISEEDTWAPSQEELALNHQSLHRCIDSRASVSSSCRMLRRLPIDLQTFLNLDPEQLNKHFAGLDDIARSNLASVPKSVSFVSAKSQAEVSRDVEKNLSKSIMIQAQTSDILNQVSRLREPLMLMLLVALVSWILVPRFQLSSTKSIDAGISMTSSAVTVSPSSISLPTPTSLSTKTQLRVTEQTKDLTAAHGQKDLSRLLSSPVIGAVNRSNSFQVEIIGDCHIIVKAPQVILQRRREPKIQILVRRGKYHLPAITSTLFEGVYSVQIEREEAYGTLNVTILVNKPSINETKEIDFGSPWLKLANWERAAQHMVLGLWKDFDVASLHSAIRSLQERIGDDKIAWFVELKNRTSRHLEGLSKATVVARETQSRWLARTRLATAQVKATQQALQEQYSNSTIEIAYEVRLALQTISRYSTIAKDRAQGLIESTSLQFREKFDAIRTNAAQIDFMELREKCNDLRKSQTLAKAQERARSIVKNSSAKLKQYQKTPRGKLRGRKHCKKCTRR